MSPAQTSYKIAVAIYLQGIDNAEIVNTIHGRPSPTISATAGLAITR